MPHTYSTSKVEFLESTTLIDKGVVTTSEVVSSRARSIYGIYVKNWRTLLAFNPTEDTGVWNRSRNLRLFLPFQRRWRWVNKEVTNPFGTTGRVSGNDHNFQEGVSLESGVDCG